MGQLRVTIGHLRVTVGHLRVPIGVKLKYTPQDATISILHDYMLSSPYGTIIILH